MHSYDYAIVRVLPRVERGEQLNAGVILSCAAAGYLRARFELDEATLRCMAPGLDLEPIRAALAGIEAVCAGGDAACPRANASTGWWRRAAPACRYRQCTPGAAPTWMRRSTT
jgi:Protein of unknown function (DUF3037)